MDEKGLAAIFVFGLPGFGQENHALMCLKSSLAILEVMETGGMDTHAGLATGGCFCGLVGDPMQRCEYAVLGGENYEPSCMQHLHCSDLLQVDGAVVYVLQVYCMRTVTDRSHR